MKPISSPKRKDKAKPPAADRRLANKRLVEGKMTEQPRKGRCAVCGCRVYRTETICSECICERDGY